MKKLFTLLTMLLVGIGSSWGQEITTWSSNLISTLKTKEDLVASAGTGERYAFRMPSFVLDAYTRRFLERLGYGFKTDEERRAFLTKGIEPSADMYGWYHWALLEHGKARCGKKPKCEGCVFRDVCRFMD